VPAWLPRNPAGPAPGSLAKSWTVRRQVVRLSFPRKLRFAHDPERSKILGHVVRNVCNWVLFVPSALPSGSRSDLLSRPISAATQRPVTPLLCSTIVNPARGRRLGPPAPPTPGEGDRGACGLLAPARRWDRPLKAGFIALRVLAPVAVFARPAVWPDGRRHGALAIFATPASTYVPRT